MGLKIRSLTAALLACGVVTAVSAMEPGFYLGGQVGATNFDNKTRSIQTNTVAPTTTLVKPSNTGIGERLFLGYTIAKYAAIEGGFTHYGPSTYKVPQSVACSNPTVNLNGLDLEGKGILPLASFALFAKAGLGFVRQTQSGSLAASSTTISPCNNSAKNSPTTSVRPLVGIGASIDVTQNWVADVSWTRVTGGAGIQTADFMGVGISYHFNDKYCGQFLC